MDVIFDLGYGLGDRTIADQFEIYGVYPRCRHCREKCKQYDAPDLLMLECPMTLSDSVVRAWGKP